MKNLTLLVMLNVFIAFPAYAQWTGYEWENQSYVDIDKGNLVREGRTIEIYDWKENKYKDVDVDDIRDTGFGVELTIYDSDTGEYRYLDMDE